MKFCSTAISRCVYPDFPGPRRSGVIPAILNSVSCDTPRQGAYFEQVTFQRIGSGLQRTRTESH
ncbi:hypothetical protein CDA56_11505 [Klebsiella michiganensis]|nr:hypothetical protein [Klebsiella michiganensis]POT79498.1 hypothetical protein C3378_10425 [Klebsiella michiganensis]PPA48388.1 hypothetical protein CDA56_11505 [Klebsiella michiganensis]